MRTTQKLCTAQRWLRLLRCCVSCVGQRLHRNQCQTPWMMPMIRSNQTKNPGRGRIGCGGLASWGSCRRPGPPGSAASRWACVAAPLAAGRPSRAAAIASAACADGHTRGELTAARHALAQVRKGWPCPNAPTHASGPWPRPSPVTAPQLTCIDAWAGGNTRWVALDCRCSPTWVRAPRRSSAPKMSSSIFVTSSNNGRPLGISLQHARMSANSSDGYTSDPSCRCGHGRPNRFPCRKKEITPASCKLVYGNFACVNSSYIRIPYAQISVASENCRGPLHRSTSIAVQRSGSGLRGSPLFSVYARCPTGTWTASPKSDTQY
eukprot:m.575701 g.575701  ORF g.575701 m.575701 type:complete len:321 (-) comp22285_c0_seq9:1434-2396(-)